MSLFSDDFINGGGNNNKQKHINKFAADLNSSANYSTLLENVGNSNKNNLYKDGDKKSLYNFTQKLIANISIEAKHQQDQKVINIISSSISENNSLTMLNFLLPVSEGLLKSCFAKIWIYNYCLLRVI